MPNSKLKKLYESISDQVEIGKVNNQQTVILRNFNAKIGNYIYKEQQRNHHKGRETLEKIGGETKLVHSKW